MPIGALANHTANTVMNLATLLGNNNTIEAYLKGAIDPADFQDKLAAVHGVPGANHRAYVGAGFADAQEYTSTHSVFANPGPALADISPNTLDSKAVIDFLSYKDAAYFRRTINPPYATPEYYVFPAEREFYWVWERLGMNPDTSEFGGGTQLTTNPLSWANWLYNALEPNVADPAIVGYTPHISSRFDLAEYWDRWLTIPYCSHRIWIPEPCILYVTGKARGTFSHNLNIDAEDEIQAGPPTQATDQSTHFRLFVDEDNRADRRPFSFTANGTTFYTNWKSINNRELSFTCYPRSEALCFGSVIIPNAGYYNISMRFMSRHWLGRVDSVTHEWFPQEMMNRAGEIPVARWECAQIGAVAQFKRSVLATTWDDSDFAT